MEASTLAAASLSREGRGGAVRFAAALLLSQALR